MLPHFVVIALSKIENLKAIHNMRPVVSQSDTVVIALSKIENLKAIHNDFGRAIRDIMLLLHYRR